jgi:tape measure domain-containing protein
MAVNLGDINFGLGADTRRLAAAKKAVIDFGRSVDRAAKATGDGAAEFARAFRRQEKAALSALQQILKFNQTLRSADAPAKFLNASKKAYAELTQELTSGRLSALEYQRAMVRFQATMGGLQRQFSSFTAEQQKQKQATDQAAQAMLRQERALFQASQAMKTFEQQAERLKVTQTTVDRLRLAFDMLEQEMKQGALSAQQFQSAMFKFRGVLGDANREVQKLRGTKIEKQINALQQAFMGLAQAAALTTGPLGGVAARITIFGHMVNSIGFAKAGFVAGALAMAAAVAKMSVAIIGAAKRLDTVRMQLATVSGSTSIAAREFEYLTNLSMRAGVSVASMATEYAKLEQAAKGTGLTLQQTRDIFEAVIFAGAKMRLNNEEISRTLKALQQMLSKGSIQMEELRNQLGDQLPGALQIMAKAMGKSTRELEEMTKKGILDPVEALPKFAQALKDAYNIDTTKRVENLVAAENRFGTALDLTLDKMDKALGLSNAWMQVLDGLSNAVLWIGDNLKLLADLAAVFAATMIGFLGGPFVGLITGAIFALIAFGDEIVVIQGRIGTLRDYAVVAWREIIDLFPQMRAEAQETDKVFSSMSMFTRQPEMTWMDTIVIQTAKLRQYFIRFVNQTIALFNGLATALQVPFSTFADFVQNIFIDIYNKVMETMAQLVNGVVDQINKLSTQFNQAAEKLGYTIRLPILENVSFERIGKISEGAGQTIAEAFLKGYNETLAERPVEKFLGQWADAADTEAQDRLNGLSEAMRFQREQARLAEEAWQSYVKGFGSGGNGSGTGGTDDFDKAADAIEDVTRKIQRLRAETDAMKQGPEVLVSISQNFDQLDAIDQVNDRLLKAKVNAAQAADLTSQFAEALKSHDLTEQVIKLDELNLEYERLQAQASAASPVMLQQIQQLQAIETQTESYRKGLEALGLETEEVRRKTDAYNQALVQMRTNSAAEAMAGATRELDVLNARIIALDDFTGQTMEFIDIQERIISSTQAYRDGLIAAGVSVDDANAKTKDYLQTLIAYEEKIYKLNNDTSFTKILYDSLATSVSGLGSTMLQAFTEGGNAAEAFQDVVIRVLGNILDKMLELWVMKPLLDSLFGPGTDPTAGPNRGLADTGGGFFSALMGFIGGIFSFGKGGAFTPGGRRYGRGGLTSGTTMFNGPAGPVIGGELGTEAIMPLKRTRGGRLGVTADLSGVAGGGVVFAPNITVNMQGSSTGKPQDDGQIIANELVKRMEPMVLQIIMKQQAPGGILA